VSRAFTLLELLVVVAIIIILAAILLPVFEQAAKKSEGVTCLSNLRNLVTGAGLYGDDWDDYLPPALVPASPAGYSTCWDLTLDPYIHDSKICLCVSDPSPTPGPAFTYSYPHSYGINLAITMVGGYQAASLQESDLNNPANLILFFDLKQPYSYGWDSSWNNATQYVAQRHLGGVNFAFCGGNCKWLPLEATLQGAGMWQP
jgi:prepilin-type N-terminal cleavage/methylation domain-containing protein/prepilin-type processing-associated H-X9-DG protein